MFALKEVVGSLPPITFTALVAVPIMFVLRALIIIIRYINIFFLISGTTAATRIQYALRDGRSPGYLYFYILKIWLEILLN